MNFSGISVDYSQDSNYFFILFFLIEHNMMQRYFYIKQWFWKYPESVIQ